MLEVFRLDKFKLRLEFYKMYQPKSLAYLAAKNNKFNLEDFLDLLSNESLINFTPNIINDIKAANYEFKFIYDNIKDKRIKFLIEPITDINEIRHGESRLEISIRANLYNIVKLLIEKGANIHVQNDRRDTPLHEAISYKLEDISKLLIEKGVNINVQNNHGNTPLHETTRS